MSIAMAFSAPGPPEAMRLVEVEPREPGPGRVRVRVMAAGVQPADTAARAGHSRLAPADGIVGNEFAGVVDRVGAGVFEAMPGDAVIGFTTMGAYAEHVTVDAGQVVLKPAGLSWIEAAALSASGQTAHTALTDLGVRAGETVLVHAAAGGVGSMAVQIARCWGATVIGTARPANHAYLRTLGAIPVAYGDGLLERVRALAPDGVDAALDAIGNGALTASLALVRDRSRAGTIVDFPSAARRGARAIRTRRSGERLRELLAMWGWHELRVHVSRTYPLHRAADAHREVEAGHVRGKVVLTMPALDAGPEAFAARALVAA